MASTLRRFKLFSREFLTYSGFPQKVLAYSPGFLTIPNFVAIKTSPEKSFKA